MPLDASLTFLGAAEQVTGSCYLLKLTRQTNFARLRYDAGRKPNYRME